MTCIAPLLRAVSLCPSNSIELPMCVCVCVCAASQSVARALVRQKMAGVPEESFRVGKLRVSGGRRQFVVNSVCARAMWGKRGPEKTVERPKDRDRRYRSRAWPACSHVSVCHTGYSAAFSLRVLVHARSANAASDCRAERALPCHCV